ncbi:MAG: hypothetical protein HP491_03990 [Nitrospira sp.]|nr:hypothetical protein [Nitrospira sp.]MBH0182580.1 hypothetical protein [Nitrospira sp.]MBH0184541.1 hypothetical protein [Nitrospira sp.]
MGLLGRLFKIPSFEGATNALLVELTLPTLTDAQRAELKIRVIEVFQKLGPPDLSPEAALLGLNQASRLTQLNFLALAMDELGFDPPLKKEILFKVPNPFDPNLADEHTLRAVARRLKWKHNIEVGIEVEPINFDTWSNLSA